MKQYVLSLTVTSNGWRLILQLQMRATHDQPTGVFATQIVNGVSQKNKIKRLVSLHRVFTHYEVHSAPITTYLDICVHLIFMDR